MNELDALIKLAQVHDYLFSTTYAPGFIRDDSFNDAAAIIRDAQYKLRVSLGHIIGAEITR